MSAFTLVGPFWLIAGLIWAVIAYLRTVQAKEKLQGTYPVRLMGVLLGIFCILIAFMVGITATVIFSSMVYTGKIDIVTSTNIITPYDEQRHVYAYSQTLSDNVVKYRFCAISNDGGEDCKEYIVDASQADLYEYEGVGNNYPSIEFHKITTDCSTPSLKSAIAGFFVGCLKEVREAVRIVIPKGSLVLDPNPILPLDFSNKP